MQWILWYYSDSQSKQLFFLTYFSILSKPAIHIQLSFIETTQTTTERCNNSSSQYKRILDFTVRPKKRQNTEQNWWTITAGGHYPKPFSVSIRRSIPSKTKVSTKRPWWEPTRNASFSEPVRSPSPCRDWTAPDFYTQTMTCDYRQQGPHMGGVL